MADDAPQDDDSEPPDGDAAEAGAGKTVNQVIVSRTLEVVSQIDERWFLYPAYILTLTAGALAAQFAGRSQEWSAGPVVLAWSVLFIWYWLYGVAFRYRRPALKYFSLAAASALGGLLTAFALDRAIPQLGATPNGAAVRGLSFDLVWCAAGTGAGVLIVFIHAILFSRSRKS